MPRRIFAYFLHKNKKKKQDHAEASIHLERAYIYSVYCQKLKNYQHKETTKVVFKKQVSPKVLDRRQNGTMYQLLKIDVN
jgi:hypothetical protein